MPAQKRSNDSVYEDEEDVELQRNNQNVSDESENDDVEQDEEADSENDDDSPSSSGSDKDEFVYVKLAEVRKDVQCPICLGIIRKTRKVMECLHRFCRECIDKSMRMGNNECPACRAHCASRRSLRDDPNFDALIALLYPDIDKYEAEELAFAEEEKARNKQIQAAIAQTSRRQLEALGKKRATAKATATAFMRRSQSSARNLRGRRRKSAEPRDSDNEVDADNDNGGNYSSSSDEPEPSTEVKPKRYKRWGAGRPSSLPSSSGANGGCDDNETDGSRKTVGASVGLVGSPEILAWGCAGMRSHTRHGGQSSGGKSARNTHNSKLIHHFKRLPQNDDEMNISLKLVSLDEQNIPNLRNLYICCKPTMPTTNVCQYVANENGLRADEIELLLVKGGCFDADSSSVSPDEQSEPVVINPLKDELRLLDGHQIMSDVAKLSNQNNLTIAYRKKSLN
ncbi:putative E3 ubiquitin-protein ligase RING1a isoform X3 [Helianthus annuus]|uniref:putative E3 ubiquitin-protein ligase RING1a isoform X3 n=1 Tax=Helianthus annuus TaxID=4232 RepID=UPI000B8F659B|nr:putative E3 ubiquitin-protein ligase RING1a isoform X3 [Helianthus annuus]